MAGSHETIAGFIKGAPVANQSFYLTASTAPGS